MAQEDKVVYLSGHGASNSGTAVYEQLRKLANHRLLDGFRHMLDQVDDALFELAEKSENTSFQTLYFDAMREVRLSRQAIEERFLQGLSERHDHPLRNRNPGVSAHAYVADELSLINQDELEESLALEAMISRVRGLHAQALATLCARLNALTGKTRYDCDTNPLDPRQIATAFESAVGGIESDIKCRLVIYKLFERHLFGRIGVLLQEVNKLLVDAGVTVESKSSVKSTSVEEIRQRQQTRTVLTRPQAGTLLHALQQLLGLSEHEEQAGVPRETGSQSVDQALDTFPVSDVVSVLSSLQHVPAEETGEEFPLMSSADIRDRLRSGLARKKATASLGRIEDSTIEIVGLLFDVVLNDSNIPDRIKALLARLQIPMLKVALVDPSLFEHASHPARKLINEMARAGVGWVDGGQPDSDLLYRAIEGIVTEISSDPGDNLVLFARSLKEFETFLAEERERARQIEERTRQAAEGKAKVEAARERVDAVLRHRMDGRQLPAVVHRLLNEAWSKVLFIPLLNDGGDSQQWHSRLAVVDQLLWSVEPKASQEERKRLVSEIPRLLQDLRTGLNSIMFNPVEMAQVFKELESEHIRLLSRPMVRVPKATTAKAAPSPGRGSEASDPPQPREKPVEQTVAPEPVISEALKSYYADINKAPIGTWFEFIQDNGRTIRAKLSARMNNGDRLIFVNRAGFKLADRRRDEMVEAMDKKRLLILDDNMLFDKALEALVTDLRSLSEGRSVT